MESSNEGNRGAEPSLVVKSYSNWVKEEGEDAARERVAKEYDSLGQPEEAARIRGEVYHDSLINRAIAFGKKKPSNLDLVKYAAVGTGTSLVLVEGTKAVMHFMGKDTDFRLFGIGMKWETRARTNNVRPIRTVAAR